MVTTVGIVGAGASGLVAIKECLQAGLSVKCWERSEKLGGLWRLNTGAGASSVYESTVINTSKDLMSFSDFPIPADWPPFLHHSRVVEYFENYAQRFDLTRHIEFSTEVVSAVPIANNNTGPLQWKITSRATDASDDDTDSKGAAVTTVVDRLIVASGHHWRESVPTFPGQVSFRGRIMHSRWYKAPDSFKGRRVLVLGVGNSGMDISVEVSRTASSTYLASRSGTWIIARSMLFGLPSDFMFNSRAGDLLPKAARRWLLTTVAKLSVGDPALWGLRPAHSITAQHPTLKAELPAAINSGRMRVVSAIREVTETGVILTDGQRLEVDDIILCTGYKVEFPWLDVAGAGFHVGSANEVEGLYKYMWPVADPKGSLAVLGLIQPLGAVMPLSEMQARWAAAVFSGRCELPDSKAMQAHNEDMRRDMAQQFTSNPKHTIQVQYTTYIKDLAKEVGCEIRWRSLWLRDPALALKCFLGPLLPAQFRLFGPDACPNMAAPYIHGAETALKKATRHRRDALDAEGGEGSVRGSCGQAARKAVVGLLMFALAMWLIAFANLL